MRSQPLFAVLCLAVSLVAPGCDDDDNDGTGGTAVESFTATLDGSSEVPQRSTTASGRATITINATSVDYRVEVQSITDVVGGHIHSGAAGENGPVRVTLVPAAVPGTTSGVLAQGTFTAADVQGITYDELLSQIRGGTAYVNVHTSVYPAGEIRGQLVRANP